MAKSTTTSALGSVLSSRGYKVIMIDLDSQCDLTISLRMDVEERNIFDCIFKHKGLLATNVNPNLVLVGGDARMTITEFTNQLRGDEEFKHENPRLVLREILNDSTSRADYVLLDCPPNLELITSNALACSDYLLIPTEPHSFSINGINTMMDYTASFQKRVNKELKILGIFLTRFRSNTRIHSEVKDELDRHYPGKMLHTVIHENITVQEATHMGKEFEKYGEEKAAQGLFKHEHPFRGLVDYRKLADEILERLHDDDK